MVELKIAHGDAEFLRDSKDYVINMVSDSHKLHKKGCTSCPFSKYFSKYYDFNSIEEVEKSGIEFSYCKRCFNVKG